MLSEQPIYCINPHCQQRQNSPEFGYCQACQTPLRVRNRYRLMRLLRSRKPENPTEVFEIADQGTPKILKVLSSDDPTRDRAFRREAEILAQLNHPSIPKVDLDGYFKISLPSGVRLQCIVLQKIEGTNLEEWVKVHGKLSQDQALQWLEALIEILDRVHGKGFFHRDIKPSNILRQPNGNLALIDFGSARSFESPTYLAKINRRHFNPFDAESESVTAWGSPGYTPPEQFNGHAVPPSDFYSIGRTWVYLMTSIQPIRLREDPQTGKLDWYSYAPQIAPPFKHYIDTLMSVLPGRRPQTTQIILQYLRSRDRLPLLLKLDLIQHWFLRTRLGKLTLGILGVLLCLSIWQAIRVGQMRNHFEQAKDAQLAKQFDRAKYHYEQALAIDPNNSKIHNNLGRLCAAQANYDCALDHYEIAIKLNPQYWEAYYNLGGLYDTWGRYPEARQYYQKVIDANTMISPAASNNLARLKNLESDYQGAIALAQKALEQPPDSVDRTTKAALLKNLGWAFFEQRDFAIATQYLNSALSLDPTRTEAQCLLAQIYQQQRNSKAADLAWTQCARSDPTLPEVQRWLKQAPLPSSKAS